jgi:GT2 family glycosyltransferase
VQKNIPGDYEIIVVDGMSEDDTRGIVDKLRTHHSQIKLVNNEKRVTPVAMNLGINIAKGEYICILGAHSVYAENYLSNCLQLFRDHPEVTCVGGPIISIGKDNFSSAVAIAMASVIGVGNAKHRFPRYEGYAEMACFPMFHRSVFDKIGLYDETLIKNQDDDYCFRLRQSGEKIYISPTAKASYYVRNTPKSLFNQYFQYGVWRVAVTKKHKIPISLRQLIPSFFITLIVVFFILGLIISNPIFMFIIPVIYVTVLWGFSVIIIFKNNFWIGLNIPLSLIILHFAYGIGFFYGLNKFRKNKMDNKYK